MRLPSGNWIGLMTSFKNSFSHINSHQIFFTLLLPSSLIYFLPCFYLLVCCISVFSHNRQLPPVFFKVLQLLFYLTFSIFNPPIFLFFYQSFPHSFAFIISPPCFFLLSLCFLKLMALIAQGDIQSGSHGSYSFFFLFLGTLLVCLYNLNYYELIICVQN